MSRLSKFVLAIAITACAVPAFAQTPNTASILVVVVDQTGGVVKDAKVTVTNTATSASRDVMSGDHGSATFPALSLTGKYKVSVSKQGFTADDVNDLVLRAEETATVRVKIVASGGKTEITVYGTAEGVRADAQIGRSITSEQIQATPILGRKLTSFMLQNSAFRSGKGTGDLFVNATYFVTASGSRRTTTYMLDGANNDEGWGRQTMLATVPVGAVQEMAALSTASSAEFGWTAGPALNIVTKSGTNLMHGDFLLMNRPGGKFQATTFSTEGFCAPTISTCVKPDTLKAINPVDIPDKLNQGSVSLGGALKKDRTFFFFSNDYTAQDRTTQLSSTLPAFLLPADGNLNYVGHYRQELFNGRVDHRLNDKQNLMVRVNYDTFYDDNPQDAVGGTSAPSVARKYSRDAVTAQVNHTTVLGPRLLNEARFAYLNGMHVTHWEAGTLSTAYTRTGSVPFTIGQSRVSDIFGHQAQFSDTLSWSHGKHYFRFGGSATRHTSGGTGNEPGQALLGTFTFKTAGTAPFDQLTLDDVSQYSQPISFGISSYVLKQWLLVGFVQDSFRVRNDLTLDLGLRYDRQTLTDAKKNFAPRLGFGWHPGGDSKMSIRGGYSVYYTQVRTNSIAGYAINGLDGIATYNATPGQLGFPTCLTGSCLPLTFDPRVLLPSQIPARNVTIQAGRREALTAQFAKFGLDFSKLTLYPDEFVNPKSVVSSIGAEREIMKGFFIGADYVHQHWTKLDRSIDINAPTSFDRTAPGQTRSTAAANATRPIASAAGGVSAVNVLMNLGEAEYDGLQTEFSYRGSSKFFAALSYTLSKATNTSEPDGNGIGANQTSFDRLGEEERGPSVVDQRHRAVITFSYNLPLNITAGTVTQLASARPFNATTGVDNNGDGAMNDRPVIDGKVISKSAFRGTGTQDISLFVEGRVKMSGRTLVLRLEGFNLMNHGNYLGRGQTVYGDGATPNTTFGQLVAAGSATNAIPAFANVDPPRMFQFQVRFQF